MRIRSLPSFMTLSALILCSTAPGCALDEQGATTSESRHEANESTPEETFTETIVSIAETGVIDTTTTKVTRSQQIAFKTALVDSYGEAQTRSFWTPDNNTFVLQFWDQENFIGNTTRFRFVSSPLIVRLDLSTVARAVEPCFGGSITKTWFDPNQCICVFLPGGFNCGVHPRIAVGSPFLEVRSAVNGQATPVGIFTEPLRGRSVVTIQVGVNPTVQLPNELPAPAARWL